MRVRNPFMKKGLASPHMCTTNDVKEGWWWWWWGGGDDAEVVKVVVGW